MYPSVISSSEDKFMRFSFMAYGHFAWNFQLVSLANCLTMETARRLEAGAREKTL